MTFPKKNNSKAGERHDIGFLYISYAETLTMQAYNILGTKEEAFDVVQDIFTNLYEKKDKRLPSNDQIEQYLRKAVSNRCIDHFRRHKLFQAYSQGKSGHREPASDNDPALYREIYNRINQIIEKLPYAQRVVLELHYSGRELDEIVLETGKSLQTVKNQLVIAKKILRQQLEDFT